MDADLTSLPQALVQLGAVGILAATILVMGLLLRPGLVAFTQAWKDMVEVNRTVLKRNEDSDRVIELNTAAFERSMKALDGLSEANRAHEAADARRDDEVLRRVSATEDLFRTSEQTNRQIVDEAARLVIGAIERLDADLKTVIGAFEAFRADAKTGRETAARLDVIHEDLRALSAQLEEIRAERP